MCGCVCDGGGLDTSSLQPLMKSPADRKAVLSPFFRKPKSLFLYQWALAYSLYGVGSSPSSGPVLSLDAEQVEEDMRDMWHTMHKLSKIFGDFPAPKRSSELFKMKLDEFKKHLPLLQILCNCATRERHWEKVRI